MQMLHPIYADWLLISLFAAWTFPAVQQVVCCIYYSAGINEGAEQALSARLLQELAQLSRTGRVVSLPVHICLHCKLVCSSTSQLCMVIG